MKLFSHTEESFAAVIPHCVAIENREAYAKWLCGITEVARRFPGHKRTDIFHPKTEREPHQVVVSFDTSEHLESWLSSEERKQWLKKAEPLIDQQLTIQRLGGLEQLVGPEIPVQIPRYKIVILTWMGVTLCTTLLSLLADPLLAKLPIILKQAVSGGLVVCALAYVVLPALTRLFRKWL